MCCSLRDQTASAWRPQRSTTGASARHRRSKVNRTDGNLPLRRAVVDRGACGVLHCPRRQRAGVGYFYDDYEEHPCAVNKHLTKDTARRMAAKFCDAARLSYQQYLKVVEGWRLRRRKMVEVQKTARPP